MKSCIYNSMFHNKMHNNYNKFWLIQRDSWGQSWGFGHDNSEPVHNRRSRYGGRGMVDLYLGIGSVWSHQHEETSCFYAVYTYRSSCGTRHHGWGESLFGWGGVCSRNTYKSNCTTGRHVLGESVCVCVCVCVYVCVCVCVCVCVYVWGLVLFIIYIR